MLYTVCFVNKVANVNDEDLLTIAAFLEILAEGPVQMEVESVPDFVAWFVDNSRPLEKALDNHVEIHGDDTEPENPLRPAFGELQQGYGKCCFTEGLPYKGTARGDVDKNLHAVIPLVDDIACCVFDCDEAVVYRKNDL